MKSIERDARLKILLLQGALYRLEIVQAKTKLYEVSTSFVMARRLLGLMTFALSHKRMAFISTMMLRLLRRKHRSHFGRYALLIAGAWAVVRLFRRNL